MVQDGIIGECYQETTLYSKVEFSFRLIFVLVISFDPVFCLLQ